MNDALRVAQHIYELKMNTEVYQDQINATYSTKFKIPVVYYSTLMAVAFGCSAKDAALEGRVRSRKSRLKNHDVDKSEM